MKHTIIPADNRVHQGFVLLFMVILLLPFSDVLWKIGPKVDVSENRNLAPRPFWEWNWKTIEAYPAKFEEYYKDNFGFRKPLIQLHTIYKAKWLCQSPNRKIIIGREGWLYFTGEDEGLLNYQKPLSKEVLKSVAVGIDSRRKWFNNRNILFFVLVAPNKQSIYPEFLPKPQDNWSRDYSAYDDLLQYFKGHSNLDVFIDVKQAMLQKKNEGESVYYRTDSHWNHASSWLAYQSILAKLRQNHVTVAGKNQEDVEWVKNQYSGDLVTVHLGIKGLFTEMSDFFVPRYGPTASKQIIDQGKEFHGVLLTFPVIITESANVSAKRVLFLRDSQLETMIPLISETFCRVIYVNYWEKRDTINTILESEKPDIVIHEMVERNIKFLPLFYPTL